MNKITPEQVQQIATDITHDGLHYGWTVWEFGTDQLEQFAEAILALAAAPVVAQPRTPNDRDAVLEEAANLAESFCASDDSDTEEAINVILRQRATRIRGLKYATTPLAGLILGPSEQPASQGPVNANELEKMATAHPDECFLKGSGVLKLIGAIRTLEQSTAPIAPPASALNPNRTALEEIAYYDGGNVYEGRVMRRIAQSALEADDVLVAAAPAGKQGGA